LNVKIDGNRSFFYQWDTGQRLIVECSDQCSEVHFSFKDDNLALVSPIKEIEGQRMAAVPNILLQKEGTLYAYLFLINEDGSETRRSISFTVLSRPKPESYIYTETEVLNYSNLAERIQELEDNGVSEEQIANAVEKYLKENPPESGVSFETDNTLTLQDGILSVNTTDQMEQDNTLPITSAGVYATVGNIEALLKTI
jgi:hypothetical protein